MKNYQVLMAVLVGTLFSTGATVILFVVLDEVVKSSPTNISFRGTFAGYVILSIVGIVIGFPTGLGISLLVALLRLKLLFSIFLGLFINFCVTIPLFLSGSEGKFDEPILASAYPFIVIGGITGAIVSLINSAFTTEETE